MKFFHLSDLHIGLKLFGRDFLEDQRYVFRQIAEAAQKEKPDAVVVAGDIYDKAVPSAEAVALFDFFVSELTAAVPKAAIMMISGNHDSGPRVNTFRNILSRQRLYMVGLPPMTNNEYIEKVTLQDEFGDVNFYLLPFVRPSMVKPVIGTDEEGGSLSYDVALRRLIGREQIDDGSRNVLVSHQFYLPAGVVPDEVERTDSEIRTVGNIDQVSADVLEQFDYAALGHIHKPMTAGKEVCCYCGTPFPTSVSEAGQKKGIILVDLKRKGEVETTVLPLKPLHEVRVIEGSLKEVLGQTCEDYVTVKLTDKVDLDVIDMQDRLQAAFPNLLEIRRDTIWRPDYEKRIEEQAKQDPFTLCCSFLKDLDDSEKAVLEDVIHTVWEVK
ncbi:MAG: exonuclease SbcCD subunit D [Lachnospiraceae bacterium]|nr:exonuclease SbcCD subunit D [Lachnospiraceae bacterium]